jgi:hypothetical protein
MKRCNQRMSILVLAIVAGTLSGCSGDSSTAPTPPPTTTSAPLSLARSLEGTWSTAIPVTFIYQTDFCGSKADVAHSQWNVTWIVTPVAGFSNVVDVEMRFSRGSSTSVGSCQPNGWVPLVSPTFFRLCASSSSVSRCNDQNYPNGYAFGSFTTDLMQLTWTHWDCVIYCSGEVTDSNQLKLTKKT